MMYQPSIIFQKVLIGIRYVRRVPQNCVTKTDILRVCTAYIFFVFLTPLEIFVPHLEILLFINNYFIVCIFKYRTS